LPILPPEDQELIKINDNNPQEKEKNMNKELPDFAPTHTSLRMMRP
jgi:hypothetical protein